MPNSESLETYLSQIAHELRDLPAQARADELREIESHLRALVLASQQIEDVSEAEATETALRQFGSPKGVGRKLRRAWERRQPEAWWRALLAPILALNFSTYVIDPFLQGFTISYVPPSFASIMAMMMLLTFAMTYGMGLISPKRAKLSVGIMLAFIVAPSLLTATFTFSALDSFGAASFALPAIIGVYLSERHSRALAARLFKVK